MTTVFFTQIIFVNGYCKEITCNLLNKKNIPKHPILDWITLS